MPAAAQTLVVTLLELEHRMPMLLTERAFARLYILYVHSTTICVLKKVQSH